MDKPRISVDNDKNENFVNKFKELLSENQKVKLQ